MFIESVAHLDPYFLTDPEIEEMDAASAGMPLHRPADDPNLPDDDDWGFYFEATYVDPAEREEPLTVCCSSPTVAARKLCGCGGYPQP